MQSRIQGLWLPLITPFRDGALDERSLRRMARHYLGQPVDGMILAATTGEGLTIDEDETERLIGDRRDRGCRAAFRSFSASREATRARSPRRSRARATWPVDGYLIACPYYTRPSQEGLYHHFAALAGETARPILDLQHPVPDRREPCERDAAAPRRTAEHRGRQGLLRRSGAVLRSDARAARRLRGDDRRGCAVLCGADARRRRRHPRRGPCRDRALRGDPADAARRRSAARHCGPGAASSMWRGCCSRNRARRRSSIGSRAPG